MKTMREYKLKTCVVCGDAYLPTGPRQLTCCDECKKKYKEQRAHDIKKTEFESKRAFDPVIEKAKNEHLSYGQAVAKMEKENGKEHMCNNMTSSRDRYDIDKNGDGYPDPTSYTAIRNIEGVGGRDIEGEKFGKLLHTIWNLCSLAGFEIQGRITIVSKETGRVWD